MRRDESVAVVLEGTLLSSLYSAAVAASSSL